MPREGLISTNELVRPDGAIVTFTVIEPGNDTSERPPLIFVPGWLCTAASWAPTAMRLGMARRCVTIDLPGFGRSRAGNRSDWSLAAFGADVAAVIAELRYDNAILVGHSMGGAVALEAAIVDRERCRRLVAVDSLIHPEFYDPLDEATINAFVTTFAADFPEAVSSAMAAYVLPGKGIPAVGDAIAAMAAADPDRGLAVLQHFLRWSVDARLRCTDIPVTVIAASGLLSAESRSRWCGQLDLRLISDVGHFIMLDEPAAFDAILSAVIGVATCNDDRPELQ